MTKIDISGHSGSIPSGPMVFKGDWPGMFFRGDECMGISDSLGYVLSKQTDKTCSKILSDLKTMIDSPIIAKEYKK